MRTTRYQAALFICAAGWLTACTTPQAVRELAEKTAANIGVLSTQVARVGQESRKLTQIRSANIAQLHAANARLRASYNYDVELTKKAGGASNLKLIDSIDQWAAKVTAIFAAADSAEAERKLEIIASHSKLDTKSQTLAEIASSLAGLAKKESANDRVRFLVGFSKQLKVEVDRQLEQSNASTAAAVMLIDELKR